MNNCCCCFFWRRILFWVYWFYFILISVFEIVLPCFRFVELYIKITNPIMKIDYGTYFLERLIFCFKLIRVFKRCCFFSISLQFIDILDAFFHSFEAYRAKVVSWNFSLWLFFLVYETWWFCVRKVLFFR